MIIVVDAAVAKLLSDLKNDSRGMPKDECNTNDVEVLERLGLVRIDLGKNGRPDWVKPLPGAWTVDVRV